MMMMIMIPGIFTYGTNTYRYSFRRYFGCMPRGWWWWWRALHTQQEQQEQREEQDSSNVETPQAGQMITMITMLTRMIRTCTPSRSRKSSERDSRSSRRSNVEAPQAVQTALLLLFLRRPSPLPQPPNPFFLVLQSSSLLSRPPTPHFCGCARYDSRFPTPCPSSFFHSIVSSQNLSWDEVYLWRELLEELVYQNLTRMVLSFGTYSWETSI